MSAAGAAPEASLPCEPADPPGAPSVPVDSEEPAPAVGAAPEPPVIIRPMAVTDCDQLVDSLYAINEYEGKDMTLPQLTASDLAREGFGERPAFLCVVADCGGQMVGHAIFTIGWAGYDGIGRCLFLTDLFVRQEVRRRGVGRRLLQAVAAAAVREGAPHIDFNVYGWNEPAVRFYRGFGCRSATDESQMLCYYCDETAVRKLAQAYHSEEGGVEEAPVR